MRGFIKMICCIGTILFWGGYANAQESVARFGVKTGINYSGQHGVTASKNKFGFNAGITLDFRLSPHIYLLTGLEYTIKGAKSDDTSDKSGTFETPTYLQLPFHVGYMYPVSREVRLVVHAGPYMAYGIGGKVEINNSTGGEKSKIDYFGVNVGKFDWGLGLGLNVEYNSFVLGTGYDRGLRNFAPIHNDGKARTKNLYMTLGYLF
ncbi:MAG: porin family protein [Dysgonomonas sp.]